MAASCYMVGEEKFYRSCVESILATFKLQSLVKIKSENLIYIRVSLRIVETTIVKLGTGCNSVGTLYMVFIRLIYHNTNGTCLMKVEKLSYE